MLDYGTQLIPVEIKAGQTINKDFFKGLNLYQNLANLPQSYLVYGGQKSYTWQNTKIYSYHDLAKLFSTLPD